MIKNGNFNGVLKNQHHNSEKWCEKQEKNWPERRWAWQWKRSWNSKEVFRQGNWKFHRTIACPKEQKSGWKGRGAAAKKWWTSWSWAGKPLNCAGTTNIWKDKKERVKKKGRKSNFKKLLESLQSFWFGTFFQRFFGLSSKSWKEPQVYNKAAVTCALKNFDSGGGLAW